MKEFNIEYVIDVLAAEEDRLLQKLNDNLSNELLEDFLAYEAIRASLIEFRGNARELRG